MRLTRPARGLAGALAIGIAVGLAARSLDGTALAIVYAITVVATTIIVTPWALRGRSSTRPVTDVGEPPVRPAGDPPTSVTLAEVSFAGESGSRLAHEIARVSSGQAPRDNGGSPVRRRSDGIEVQVTPQTIRLISGKASIQQPGQ